MNYELAKQLKEAGFPQDSENRYENGKNINISNDNYNGGFISFDNYGEDIANPSLSELIETCGDGFKYLERGNSNYWQAVEIPNGRNDEQFQDGSTPEEAVAKLWLALNKK